MLNNEVIELLTERLVNRIEEGNTYVLKSIAESLKKIGTLTPSKARELQQILKYGGSYEKIAKKLAGLLNVNVKDIYNIFDEMAKRDQQFAKQFYKYKNVGFIPYDKNKALQNQVRALARQTANTYINMANTSAIGFSVKDLKGNTIFKGLKEVYYDAIDRAVLSVAQGKETFDEELSNIIKELGDSGIKTIEYQSGRTMRLDSAIRMNLQGALRDMHNNLQEQFGEEYGADGVEISVHINPAPDHEEAQGRQFSTIRPNENEMSEWEKLQTEGIAKDYTGKIINMHLPTKNGEAPSFRPISEMNCYHYIFSIVLGVNKPEYNDKQLEQIIKDNEKGFDYEGKHYTNYEGQQLQRRIETEIRKQKDIQIMAKASGDEKNLLKSQSKINVLTQKYKELNSVSGLKPKMERLKVSGYHKIKVPDTPDIPTTTPTQPTIPTLSVDERINNAVESLKGKNVTIGSSIYNLDKETMANNLEQLDILTSKYKHDKYFDQNLNITTGAFKGRTFADASYKNHEIRLSSMHYKDRNILLKDEGHSIETGWSMKVPEDKYDVYTLTHEYGHHIEYNYLKKIRDARIQTGRRFDFKDTDKDLQDLIIGNANKNLGLTKTEFKEQYFSGYAKSKRNYEWFAETFARMELGEETPLTKALKEWLEKFYE